MERKYRPRYPIVVLLLLGLLVVTTGLHAEDTPAVDTDETNRSEETYSSALPFVVSMPPFQVVAEPGVDAGNVGLSQVTFGSILPMVTETGLLSLSVDGLGTATGTGTIQVDKPAGSTVRGVYLAAASRGFSSHQIADEEISIAGNGVAWDLQTPSSINSFNYWADVTAIVKPIVDAAPAGRVDLAIEELNGSLVDGEALAVIFEDPNQTSKNTVVLLFGAQDVAGDTFNIALAEPVDTADPALTLNLSLGISYSFQGGATTQASLVDVNGVRLTSSAGGQDDGAGANGALLTVGGLDDQNDNPPPLAYTGNPRLDDELYTLVPFVADGDTEITVFTRNPSKDDNVFFASLFLTGEAIVGEGILLSPDGVANRVGEDHTVTARVQDDDGNPVANRPVTFTVVSGPHAGVAGTAVTDADGEATFTYTGTLVGTDLIEATFEDSRGVIQTSNQVTKIWEPGNEPPVVEADIDPVIVDEGQTAANTGTDVDPDGDPVALTASVGAVTNGGDGTWSWTLATIDGPAQSQTVTISAADGNGGTAQTRFELVVNNVAPTVDPPTVPTDPVNIADQPLAVDATFSDPAGTEDEPYTCTVDYGDGSGPQTGTVTGMTCTGPDHVYAAPGVYTITVAVTDKDGGTGRATAETFVVVYDPAGGFVTGGGWIRSEAGDCRSGPVCAGAGGKATFGFVAKYKKNGETPAGNTEFYFHAGSLNFHAADYEWLVVDGARAQYQGRGTVDGTGDYRFRVTVYDAAVDSDDAFERDRFRIRIWTVDAATGAQTVLYDSGIGPDLGAGGDSGTDELGSGSIVIHLPKN